MSANIIQWPLARRFGNAITDENRPAFLRVIRRKLFEQELDQSEIPDYSVDKSYPHMSPIFERARQALLEMQS